MQGKLLSNSLHIILSNYVNVNATQIIWNWFQAQYTNHLKDSNWLLKILNQNQQSKVLKGTPEKRMEQTIWSRISQTKLNVGRHLFVPFSLTRFKVWRVVNCQTFSILGLFCWLTYFELSNRRMNDMLLSTKRRNRERMKFVMIMKYYESIGSSGWGNTEQKDIFSTTKKTETNCNCK